MIWLAWRQLRVHATVVYAALAVLAGVLAVTGPQLAAMYHADHATFLGAFGNDHAKTVIYVLGLGVVYVLPAIIGAFWGAPMVARELEAHTHRLVWNQTVTRHRWLAGRMGLSGLAAVGAAGLICLAVTWWCGTLDHAVVTTHDQADFLGAIRIAPSGMGARGILPIGYTAVAFVAGVAAGMLLRRTVAAMAVTLAAVVAVQFAVPQLVQPVLFAPKHVDVTITMQSITSFRASGPGTPVSITIRPDLPGAWIVANETVDRSGNALQALPSWARTCLPLIPGATPTPTGEADRQACYDRLSREGYRQRITYQPDSRYWTFQWTETALLFALAALLAAASFWRLRRLS
jgi:hypothetical protein